MAGTLLACGALAGALLATAVLADTVAASDASAPVEWQDSVAWQGQQASVKVRKDGGFVLAFPGGRREIAPQPMRTATASPLFDGLFAMAQAELAQDKVDAITDWSFNDQKPYPCVCFETGEKWHYVWTRDLSYAADLALARLDPERTKTSLRFKLSEMRNPKVSQGLVVAQDTGSGGSWPISTDRVVWFLAARHLLGDPQFKDETWRALKNTLAQDDLYAWDPEMQLYRGETSFLDWREQNYPAWTAKDTTWIAQSFALSTNVLHYEALRLAATMAPADEQASYADRAKRLRKAINARFWREDRGLYMSYLGPWFHDAAVESYDLLGTSLAVTSGVAPPDRARRAIERYPVSAAGSPVIWPQQPETAIYHNRAIWPFVSAYALRAARTTGNTERIAFEVQSIMRGAALAGSNMENYELTTQAVHFEDGKLSGPVVNSPRQLWSVAAYLDMVQRGVFGLEDDGSVKPMIPAQLVPMLFGERSEIVLQTADRRIVLRKPDGVAGGVLVAGARHDAGRDTIVALAWQAGSGVRLSRNGAAMAPSTPAAPVIERDGNAWKTELGAGVRLYSDGWIIDDGEGPAHRFRMAQPPSIRHCYTVTNVGPDAVESLPSPTTCIGPSQRVAGAFPRAWTPPRAGRYIATFRYRNANGPINTGITAAVKRLVLQCGDAPAQTGPIVMPHREGEGDSTSWTYTAKAGVPCRFTLHDGTNMSDLAHFVHYTGGKGGAGGPLNDAEVGDLILDPTH
ncbi:hypothetical protein LYSHEL_22910 [Lysobacter helvus]|uniref:Alpha-L-rhamnosidase six-hairpin glycosidase domain-containing protein n=3 Tax=Lysobacterales TaxID=135614 RepID=A0ABN6FU84_9GAMM|nr:hypothetical protein LYSCAS_22910 [Lysobacter caseinilyticus]BCT96420.1 hypothetical protein LYSHEL_22910 [Lysobacter helvus]